MSTSSDLERLRNLFGERVNSLRKNLLVSSVVLMAIAITEAVPTKIEALGIQFETDQREAFFWGLIAIVVYFLVSFVIAVVADLKALQEVENMASGEKSKVLSGKFMSIRLRLMWETFFPVVFGFVCIVFAMLNAQSATG